MTEGEKVTVAVTKFEAARRQLNAAILMYFREDDELAVHSVGHAAFRLVRELLKKRGTDDVHEELLTRDFYEMLRAHRRGMLGSVLEKFADKVPEEMWKLIEENDYENVRASLSGYDRRAFWNAFDESYNFLKHDHRKLDALDLDQVDNEMVLSYASASYVKLGLAPTVEILTFFTYCFSLQPFEMLPPEMLRRRVEALRKYDIPKRKLACRYIIGDSISSVSEQDDDP